MNDHVVYIHYIKGTDIPFYVGEGRDHRALKSSGRNKLYNFIECLFGADYEIVVDGLSKSEALEIETQLIEELSIEHAGTITNIKNKRRRRV